LALAVDDFAFEAADLVLAVAPPEDFALPLEDDEDFALGREEDFFGPDFGESECRTPSITLAPAPATAPAPPATVLPIERRTPPAPAEDFFQDFAAGLPARLVVPLLLFLP
jgi:hypothetical protein